MNVKLYTKATCPYSQRALATFDRLGIPYENIDITSDEDLRAEMIDAAGGKTTVPQIFIAGKHIGGSDDLKKLESAGELHGGQAEASP